MWELNVNKSLLFGTTEEQNINMSYFNHFGSSMIIANIHNISKSNFENLKRLSSIKLNSNESLIIWYKHKEEEEEVWEIIHTNLIGWHEIEYLYKFQKLITNIPCLDKNILILKCYKYNEGIKVQTLFLLFSLQSGLMLENQKKQVEIFYDSLVLTNLKKSNKFHMFAQIISNYMKPFKTFNDCLLDG